MPSSYPALQYKFFADGTDGILKAEEILKAAGFTIDRFVISPPEIIDYSKHTSGELIDARDWLIDEWDYGWRNRDERLLMPSIETRIHGVKLRADYSVNDDGTYREVEAIHLVDPEADVFELIANIDGGLNHVESDIEHEMYERKQGR